MFFWWDTLKRNIVLSESIFEFRRAFIVQNMKLGCMALLDELLVNGFPSVADAGSLTIGNSIRMNRVGVHIIENKNVMVAATRGNGKSSCLIGVRF